MVQRSRHRHGLTTGATKTNYQDTPEVDAALDDILIRLAALESPTPPPPPPPPPPSPPNPGIYGPAIAADGKDNRWIGMSKEAASLPKREVAHRWRSAGGRMVSYAFNQRSDDNPEDANYSQGDGGLIELSLWTCGADGLPATQLAVRPAFKPRLIGEDKAPLAWDVQVPAGLVCVVHRNLAPAGQFCSANEIWTYGTADSPRQPAFPDDSLAVLSRGEYGDKTKWQVVANNTPVFDAAFADGRHEGQAYHERFKEPIEIVIGGSVKVRERFTPKMDLNVVAVWMRVYRKSGTVLNVTLAGKSASADLSALPITRFTTVWVDARWVRIPLAVMLPANVEQSLVFSCPSGSEVRVPPLRVPTGPSWGSRQFTDGIAEKTSGTSWSPMYEWDTGDIQFYLETI